MAPAELQTLLDTSRYLLTTGTLTATTAIAINTATNINNTALIQLIQYLID
jgi:hypothetical protein